MARKNKYLDSFHELRCSEDVLAAADPINNQAKELTEAMSLVNRAKGPVLSNPGKVTWIDLCAGNALTGIIAAHLLPVKNVVAVDITPRRRPGHENVKDFHYLGGDITRPEELYGWGVFQDVEYVVVTSSHPCGDLANHVMDFVEDNMHVVLKSAIMPCCIHKKEGTPSYLPHFLREKTSPYEEYCANLAIEYGWKGTRDSNVISPCNIVLWQEFVRES